MEQNLVFPLVIDPLLRSSIGQVLEIPLILDQLAEFLTYSDYQYLARTAAYNHSLLIYAAPWEEHTFHALR